LFFVDPWQKTTRKKYGGILLPETHKSISGRQFCQGEIREMTGFGVEWAGFSCERTKIGRAKTIMYSGGFNRKR
jgi:hypothetical protein